MPGAILAAFGAVPGLERQVMPLREAGWFALGALVFTGLMAGWSWSLRRQVRQRTEALRKAKEAKAKDKDMADMPTKAGMDAAIKKAEDAAAKRAETLS